MSSTRRTRVTFQVEMLPAAHGDCLLITYGSSGARNRLLIDCGTRSVAGRIRERVAQLSRKERQFELFVLTHIDSDHIGGAIEFLQQDAFGLTFEDVWFNGWKHLPKQRLGARQGEIFSTLIRDKKLPWNEWQGGKAIQIRGNELPTRSLPGGMQLTLLSPTRDMLARLAVTWKRELRRHGLVPGSRTQYRKFLRGSPPTDENFDQLADSRFRKDTSRANGSSIALLAEYRGKSVLLAGDAQVPVLVDSIRKLIADRGGERLEIDALKLSHHASQGNTSKELIQLFDCRNYLVSTNGSIFKHPDGEALARVIKYSKRKPVLHFNYSSRYNSYWSSQTRQKELGFTARYPPEGQEGLRVRL